MSFELAFTPSGRLTVVKCLGELADVARPAAGDGRLDPLLKSFASSQAEGLFGLATKRFDTPLPPCAGLLAGAGRPLLHGTLPHPERRGWLGADSAAARAGPGGHAAERSAHAGGRVSDGR